MMLTVVLSIVLAIVVFDRMSQRQVPEPRSFIEGQAESPHTFLVTINHPDESPRIKTDLIDHHGKAVDASCVSCHATRTPNVNNKSAKDLDEFHQNLKFDHGSLSCLSCHNSNDYSTLKRSDGQAISYKNVMILCAQCHGPQHRDYQKGSHGGMTGHWDLTKGPRKRKNCTDCHNAHSPKYPKMYPVFPPKDRGLKFHE